MSLQEDIENLINLETQIKNKKFDSKFIKGLENRNKITAEIEERFGAPLEELLKKKKTVKPKRSDIAVTDTTGTQDVTGRKVRQGSPKGISLKGLQEQLINESNPEVKERLFKRAVAEKQKQLESKKVSDLIESQAKANINARDTEPKVSLREKLGKLLSGTRTTIESLLKKPEPTNVGTDFLTNLEANSQLPDNIHIDETTGEVLRINEDGTVDLLDEDDLDEFSMAATLS